MGTHRSSFNVGNAQAYGAFHAIPPHFPLSVLCWKVDLITFRLFRSPFSKPSLVPTTSPNSFLVLFSLEPKANTHANVTRVAVMQVLEAPLISLTGLSTFHKRCSLRSYSTCVPEFAFIRSNIIPVLARRDKGSRNKVFE